jgi:uncharacterized protein (TIGR00297 family)
MNRASGVSDGRQLVHLGMGAAALLLRWITPTEAMVIAAAAVVFTAYALPYIAASPSAPPNHQRNIDFGVVFYPAAVLLVLLLLPDRIDIVASVWGIVGFGNGTAPIAARYIGGPRIPWNPRRTLAGCVVFVLLGGAAGAFLCWWCSARVIPPAYPWFGTWVPFAAAFAAAGCATLPIALDENISVPVTAAAVLWTMSLVNEDLVAETVRRILAVVPVAVIANLGAAAVGYLAGTVTLVGAVSGALIGIVVIATVGWGGWLMLLATFGIAVAASRIGLGRKSKLGVAESRRGVANALANTGVALVAAILCATTYASEMARIAFVAALAAGGSDTVASEIGKAWARRTFLVTSLARVAPGTSGAVSVEGTLAGVSAAVLLGGIAAALGLTKPLYLIPVVASAFAGSTIESVLGAEFEANGVLDNNALNLINTAIAALLSVWIAKSIS